MFDDPNSSESSFKKSTKVDLYFSHIDTDYSDPPPPPNEFS
jgi:hypothetical protein